LAERGSPPRGRPQSRQQSPRVEPDGVGKVEHFDDVDPSLPGLHSRNEGLMPAFAGLRRRLTMSTAALLDLLGLSHTTANGRLLAKTMRSLGFIPLKSRRLMPGGYPKRT
jgi:hypothetical protein